MVLLLCTLVAWAVEKDAARCESVATGVSRVLVVWVCFEFSEGAVGGREHDQVA